MTKSPNVKSMPDDTTNLRQAVAALNQLERDKRAAAGDGADPAATAALASVQAGKARAAVQEPVDDGRMSDATVKRMG